MAASSDPGPSRKRTTTYGKAVRKRMPDHIAFKALQDPDIPLESPRSASVSASTGSFTTNSPSSSSVRSKSIHIFKVPSSDDDASEIPHKKRKTAHLTRGSVVTSMKSARHADPIVSHQALDEVETHSLKAKEFGHGASSNYRHDSRGSSKPGEKIQSMHDRSKISDLKSSEKATSDDVMGVLKRGDEGRVGISSKQIHKDDPSTSYSTINPGSNPSSRLSKNQVGAHTGPPKALAATNGILTSRQTTPPTVDCDAYDLSTAVRVSSILTPKGAKMWSDLLDEASDKDSDPEELDDTVENVQYGTEEHRGPSRDRKIPRRRLIDSLVKQSKNTSFMLDLYTEVGEMGSATQGLASPSQFTPKLEAIPTRIAKAPMLREQADNTTKSLSISQNAQLSGAKITYSRQRSMLAEQDLAKEPNFDIPLEEGLPMVKTHNRRGSIPILAPLQGLHESAEVEDGSAVVAIRTIHELRQAGAESRFKDEVEDLLDRIGKPAPQNVTRRSGLFELVQKMKDRHFYTKFIGNSIDQRLFLLLGQEEDIISGYILVSILILILEAGNTPMVVANLCRQGIIRLLIRLLSVDDSILAISESRKSNLSKSAQTTLREQHDALLQMRVWGDLRPQVVSPRTASLRCLELMIRQSREAGDTGDIMSKELICSLFEILKASYDNIATAADDVDFQLALSTLVSHSLNPMTGIEEFWPIVSHILEATMQKTSQDSTVILLLRLVLNTTNNSPDASDAFASPELLQLMCRAVIEKFRILSDLVTEDKRLILVDHLVLILVVMINITEMSIRARQSFITIQDNSLEELVIIFQDNIERAFEADSVEDSHRNVAGGYLAVLLGCLSLSPEIVDRMRMRQHTFSVQPLIACIDEFISHHKKVDALLKEEGEHNPQAGLADRLQTLVDELKEMNI